MGYLVVGIIWSFWLEWFTTKNGLAPWIWRERLFHVALWPFSLSVFLINFFKGL